jgi:hypothetical protein
VAGDYGAVIRHMADAVKITTGESVFTGAEHRGRGNTVYLFTSATISNGPEALDYMRGLWIKAGRPIRCNCGATYRTEADYAGHREVMNTWHHRVTPYPEDHD